MTWQYFLIGYGVIGLITCAGALTYKQFIAPPDPLVAVHEILRKHKELHNPIWEVRVDAFLENVLAPAVATCLVVVCWPMFVWMWLKKLWSAQAKEKVWALERKHLVERHDLKELEACERVTDPLGAVPALPFGHLNGAWDKFKQNLFPGDEIWSFAAPCDVWGKRGVRYGYVIIRNGESGPFWITDYRDVDEIDGDKKGAVITK